ncbi:MAG: T9SS type A sorting domain-containing protein [Crocinitomix sp.]|nr:T9SS type A sorting domain-containing protein [Crocinitomix sp.]
MSPKSIITTLLFLVSVQFSFAQIEGGNAYLMGDFINIAVDGEKGKEGTAEGAGFHYRGGAGTVPCGFVADPDSTDWDLLLFNGDYFTPGSPENGFGLEIDGVQFSNNASGADFGITNTAPITHAIAGSCIEVNWQGEADGVKIGVNYKLKTGALYYTTEITLINTTGGDLTDLYYYRSVDADNNQSIGGSFVTTNTIVAQPDSSCQKALVSATQDEPFYSYLGFGAVGSKFRVTHGGFSNRDASDIWNAEAGLTGTEGAVLESDQAISLAYKTDLAAGDSVKFSFAIVLSEEALDAAFSEYYNLNYLTEEGITGLPWDACEVGPGVDTVIVCAGEPVLLFVEGDFVVDYDWIWSPAEGLTTTEGDSTYASLDTSITYTVTAGLVDCYTITPQQIVYLPYGLAKTVSDDVTIFIGESTTLEATGGDSYEWFPTEGLSDPLSAITDAAPTVTTEYFVSINAPDSSDCGTDTLSVTVFVDSALGIKTNPKSKASLYPNPFNVCATLDFGENLTENHTVMIFDITGRIVYEKHDVTGTSLIISSENLVQGAYILSVINAEDQEIFNAKLLLE